MAIEAHHLHLENRDIEDRGNLYNTQMGFRITENLIPFYTCPITDSLPAVTMMNNASDSGLTCNLSTPQQQMREINNSSVGKDLSYHPPFSFLGDDISLHFQQQQSEIDRFITQHMEKARIDLAESRQQHAKRIFAAVEEGMMKRLKGKEEEIEKMGRFNWVLEERVKSLCFENQMWRDLARTNEETANGLRTNLEKVLAQVRNEQQCELAEDIESCCDSSEEGERRNLVDSVKDNNNSTSCKNCGKEEPCVLLLPCRHLCLCTKCGSRLITCPICKTNMSGSVHVNI